MRIAAKGKWFIQATDLENGKKFFPLYDGFNTKKEALNFCEKMNKATPKFHHEVIRK